MADDMSNSQLPMGSYGDDITPKNRASPGYNSNIFDGAADQNEDKVKCKRHDKNIEAYCMNDKQILCIDCILSGDHKNHEISALSKAAKKERDILTSFYQQSKNIK